MLNHLEETGSIRRGYFVEGLGGLQFALPGAVDRLRAAEQGDEVLVLAAADPANPYGTLVPWPEQAEGRASRSAGAYVILHDGSPLVFLERGGKKAVLLTREPDLHAAAAEALTEIGLRHRRLIIETIDGEPAGDHPLGPALLESGFAVSLHGLAYRGPLVVCLQNNLPRYACHRRPSLPAHTTPPFYRQTTCEDRMPEGDTVHGIADRIRERIGGRPLVRLGGSARCVRRHAHRLRGTRVRKVGVVGKHLLIDFEGGWTLRVHLGMTGRWRFGPPAWHWKPPVGRSGVTTPPPWSSIVPPRCGLP